jgi:hypothetical protein
MIRSSNHGTDKSFFSSFTCSDRLWLAHALLFSGCRGSFPGVKRPGRHVNHTRPSNADCKSGVINLLPLHAIMVWANTTLLLSFHSLYNSVTFDICVEFIALLIDCYTHSVNRIWLTLFNIWKNLRITKTGSLFRFIKLTLPITDALDDGHCLKYI